MTILKLQRLGLDWIAEGEFADTSPKDSGEKHQAEQIQFPLHNGSHCDQKESEEDFSWNSFAEKGEILEAEDNKKSRAGEQVFDDIKSEGALLEIIVHDRIELSGSTAREFNGEEGIQYAKHKDGNNDYQRFRTVTVNCLRK